MAVKVSVNVLCIVGAIFGVTSLFVPWCYAYNEYSGTFGYGDPAISNAPLSTGALSLLMSSTEISAFVALTIAGTVLMLITPLGGTLEGAGAILFVVKFDSYVNTTGAYDAGSDVLPGMGIYLALVGTAIVLMSLVLPLRTGTVQSETIRSRLLAFRSSSPLTSQTPAQEAKFRAIGAGLGAGAIAVFLCDLVVANEWVPRYERYPALFDLYILSIALGTLMFLVGTILILSAGRLKRPQGERKHL